MKKKIEKVEKFNFFVPATIQKGADSEGNLTFNIKGIMSDDFVEDSDQEVLEVSGFDYKPFLTKGFFNWDHQAKKRASAIVGEPTLARTVSNGNGYQSYVEGFLYPHSVDAQEIVVLAEVLEKNSKTRRLGFSIEGSVLEKDPMNPKRIKRARITGCAITPCPKNPNTLMQLVKGEYNDLFVDNDDLDEDVIDVIKGMEVDQDLTQHDPISEIKHTKKKKTCKCEDECKCDEASPVGLCLRKSEIYENIANRYTTNAVEAKKIYSFIENVNQKLFNNMTNAISPEALKKAFDFLDEASGFQKSEADDKEDAQDQGSDADEAQDEEGEKSPPADPKEQKVDEDDDSQDDDEDKTVEKGGEGSKGGKVVGHTASGKPIYASGNEHLHGTPEHKKLVVPKSHGGEHHYFKTSEGWVHSSSLSKGSDFDIAKGIAENLFSKGHNETQVSNELMKGGYSLDLSLTVCSACIAAASAAKDGGTITTVSAPVVKSEESSELQSEAVEAASIVKSDTNYEDLIKGLAGNIGGKFHALGQILQSKNESEKILKSQVEELSTLVKGMGEELRNIGRQSQGRKSITAQPVERFDKSENVEIGAASVVNPNHFDLNKSEDVAALAGRLYNEALVVAQSGRPSDLLEKAVGDLEITKSLPKEVMPALAARGITVTPKKRG